MLQFSHNDVLPYITRDLPGIGGRLRAKPDHFVVEETPLYEPEGEGQHLYVRITKTGMTTKEVEQALTRIFGLGRGGVGFAGMKDKRARTTQTFSLAVGHQDAAFADEAVKRIERELPVTVHWARYHRNKLKLGHLLDNRFVITVSGLTLPAEDSVEDVESRVRAVIERIREQGLPNYFGPQRFGIHGGNVEKGLEVLRGKRYVRDKWLRRFLVSAYQSYLCNVYLAERVERGLFGRLMSGDVAKKYATGGLFDVEDLEAEQIRYASQEISFTAPLYGSKMRAAAEEAGELEAEILAQTPVTERHFQKAKVQGTRRLGRILVPDLAAEMDETDDGPAVTVSFTLTKGAFATTVMREIMKID
jgi:tRNA pseudouridine13 synthase